MKFLQSLRPMVVKEFRQIRRDPTSLLMLLALPAAMIIMVGYALNFDVKHIPLVIWDQDRGAESRELAEKFRHTVYFDHLYQADAYPTIEELFLEGKAKVALVIPPSYGRDLLRGVDTHVQILVDGSDANTAGQAVGYASRMMSEHSVSVAAAAFQRAGGVRYLPLDLRSRVWYNPDLVSARFLVPGLIGIILVLTAVVSTAMTVVREKELGTMEQIAVSPLTPLQVVLGKTLPYVGISLVAATAILVLGYFLFGIEIKGSIWTLYGAILLLLFGALGQGLLISTVTESQQVAFMMAIFSSLLPSFLLSGFVFPIASMPAVLQILSYLAVPRYFLVVVRGIMLKGVAFADVWPQFVYLALFAMFTLGVSVRRMKKRTL